VAVVHLQTGDDLVPAARPNPGLTMLDAVRCYFHEFEPELAERLMLAEGMADKWVERFERRLCAIFSSTTRQTWRGCASAWARQTGHIRWNYLRGW
jgi:hypothetical protein